MNRRVQIKKRLLGGYSVSYNCPYCDSRPTSSLNEAGTNDICPDCSRQFVVPGTSGKDRIQAQKDVTERQRHEKAERDRQQNVENIERRKAQEKLVDNQRRLETTALPNQPTTSIPTTGQTCCCPYCAEEILAAAKTCKHCGGFLDGRVRQHQIVQIPNQAKGNSGCTLIINCTRDRVGCCYPRFTLDVSCMCLAVFVYAANTWLLKSCTSNAFVHSYLNDVFATPFVLGYSNLLIGLGGFRQLSITTPRRILAMTCVCYVVWEWFAPLVNSRAVCDIFDLGAYAFGSSLYIVALAVVPSDVSRAPVAPAHLSLPGHALHEPPK